ncbi:hypothetical protein BT96DRAFT_958504 [Gymnopus androsaceus JB14]|uniref:Ubiquitin-like domain-containing protein n=1 Tax=Gymnopus androsaceus JB14 TaxID=1447944 RepID=A0A6A4HBP3_9AGAR|nr:hypothetical protein BT96DRAFT_958504 [Gymnopus androsaceus JB14]
MPSAGYVGTLRVFVILPDMRSERHFDPHITVEQLKSKIELFTGIPAAGQSISILNSEDDPTTVVQLSDDSKPLGFYSLKDWQVSKVDDLDPATSFTGQLTDVSQVEMFEMCDAAYAEREDSVHTYKQRNKKLKESAPSVDILNGAWCQVESLEPGLSKRGTVRFVGETQFASGI